MVIQELVRHTVGVLVFAAMFALLVDVAAFLYCPRKMITPKLQRYFGGSTYSLRAAVFGFILGALLVHFTEWGNPRQ